MKLINRGKRIKREIFCGKPLHIDVSWEKEGCVECQKYVPGCKSHGWKLGGLCENNQNLPNCLTFFPPCVPSTYLSTFHIQPLAWHIVHIKMHEAASSAEHENCGFKPTHCKAQELSIQALTLQGGHLQREAVAVGVFEHLPTYTLTHTHTLTR